jgi:hypothetical protein
VTTVYGGRVEGMLTVPSGVTIAATNSGGTGTSVSLTAGTYKVSDYLAMLQSRLNAVRTPAEWTVTLSTGRGATGFVTIDCVGETYAITWTDLDAGTAAGFSEHIASTSSPSVATLCPPGLWLPDCPAVVDGHPDIGNKQTDSRSTEGPWGETTTYKNTHLYQHTGWKYSHVPVERIREATSGDGSSLEQWLDDTQFGDGHPWFSPGSKFQVYWDSNGTDRLLGFDLRGGSGPEHGWSFSPAITSFTDLIKRVGGEWLGMWSVDFPRIVSRG